MYRQQFPHLAARVRLADRVASMRAFRVVSRRVTTAAATAAVAIAMTTFVCLTKHLLY